MRPPMFRFRVFGVVREEGTGRLLPGLVVLAYDKDLLRDDDLGRATTDAEGAFEIQFSEDAFWEPGEGHPDIYLKVLATDGKTELLSTEDAVRWEARADERFELEIPAGRVPSG